MYEMSLLQASDYGRVVAGVLGSKKCVQILKPRNCCRAMLSADNVCRTENFLDRLDNFSSSSYLLL